MRRKKLSDVVALPLGRSNPWALQRAVQGKNPPLMFSLLFQEEASLNKSKSNHGITEKPTAS